MGPGNFIRLKTAFWICLFSCFAGVVFQLLREERLDYHSVLIGLPLGLGFVLLELFIYPKTEGRIRRWSFTSMLLLKITIYTIIINLVTGGLAVVAGMIKCHEFSNLAPFTVSTRQLLLILYSLVIYSVLVFFLQVNHLLGAGILWKFLRGKYHRPREEERIFMFLDMRSSTTIAERLGHVQFYTLLNELFHDISLPILQTNAEIYQYIGDEVVLSWEMKDGLRNANCLKVYFKFREIIEQNNNQYLNRFGVSPSFKAGLHYGKVVSAQIGDLKREIVYNGDVLNTTSRIQNECNTYKQDCLISGELRELLKNTRGYDMERLDFVALRGKKTEIEIFSVNRVI
jgi:adenylate cyclase